MSQDGFRPSRFQILPPVVKNLLIINGIMYFASYVLETTFGLDLTKILGLYVVGSPLFKPYQLVTHLFMHGNIAHIFSNMFALWMFGNVLENYWGGKKFLTYYIITGLGAALIHQAVTYYGVFHVQQAVEAYMANPTIDTFTSFVSNNVPDEFQGSFQPLLGAWAHDPGNPAYISQSVSLAKELVEFKQSIPTVGASGAVFGVLMAFGVLFPNTLIYVYFFIPLKAKYFVLIYGFLEFYAGFQNNPGDNVAHFAHLGGMLFGFILVKYWNKNDRQRFY